MTRLLDPDYEFRDINTGETQESLEKGILERYMDSQGVEKLHIKNPAHSIPIKEIENIKYINPLIRRAYFEIKYINGETEKVPTNDICELFEHVSS